MRYMTEKGIAATKMTVTKPTLDEVFMEYTGKYIRDEEGDGGSSMFFNARRLRR